jgi:hypothetical protein
MRWLDSVFWTRHYSDGDVCPAIALQLEKGVSISRLDRLLAALAFRGPDNLAAFMLPGSQKTAPNYPPRSTYHSNVMFFEPSILCLWEVKSVWGLGKHQNEG